MNPGLARLKKLKGSTVSANTCKTPTSINYRTLYAEYAETVAEDCWSLDLAWLLAHPEWWEQLRDLDSRLALMERTGVSEPEYRATLALTVALIRNARARQQQEHEQSGEGVAVQ